MELTKSFIFALVLTITIVNQVNGNRKSTDIMKLLKRAYRSVMNRRSVKCNVASVPEEDKLKIDQRSPYFYTLTINERLDSPDCNLFNREELTKRYENRTESNAIKNFCRENLTLSKFYPSEFKGDCPYYWKVNHNPNRLPEYLMEAECLCDKPKRTLFPNNANVEEKCEKMTYDVPVMYKERCSADMVSQYRMAIEKITVGCVKTIATRISLNLRPIDETAMPTMTV